MAYVYKFRLFLHWRKTQIALTNWPPKLRHDFESSNNNREQIALHDSTQFLYTEQLLPTTSRPSFQWKGPAGERSGEMGQCQVDMKFNYMQDTGCQSKFCIGSYNSKHFRVIYKFTRTIGRYRQSWSCFKVNESICLQTLFKV